MINEIKKFLQTQNLNWTGEILTVANQDFRPAKEEDFKDLDIIEFLISFGKQGYMSISIEIDLANFRILGETFDCGFDKYAGKNPENKKLCKERDLSKEWVDFQFKNNSLLYSADLRVYCKKNKNILQRRYEEKEKSLNAKMKVLQLNKAKSLKVYKDLEEQVREVEKKHYKIDSYPQN